MTKTKTAIQIRDEMDKEKAKAHDKKRSHHLTRVTGLREPAEYVVCTDGTEIAYSKSEEEKITKALFEEALAKKLLGGD